MDALLYIPCIPAKAGPSALGDRRRRPRTEPNPTHPACGQNLGPRPWFILGPALPDPRAGMHGFEVIPINGSPQDPNEFNAPNF